MWYSGKIIAKAATLRSYIVRNNKRNIIRRNIRHLKNVNHVPGNLEIYPTSDHRKKGLVDKTSQNKKDDVLIVEHSKRP